MMTTLRPLNLILFLIPLMAACAPGGQEDPEVPPEDSSSGLITSLILNFRPVSGSETLSFGWTASKGDDEVEVDSIPLPDRTDHHHHDTQAYNLEVELWNDHADPVVDVGSEVEDAAEEYQLFFTGSAVEGPATGSNAGAVIAHDYLDSDSEGLPLGLENRVDTLAWGAGLLTVTLRHLPSQDGQEIKNSSLADDVANDGFDAIGGETAIQVTFEIEVE